MKRLDINGNKKTKAIKKKEEFQGIIRLIQRGNMKLAQSALEEYLEKYPRNSYAIKEYASILRQQGNSLKALEYLSQIEEEKIFTIREKAYCYIYMEEYEKALAEINRATWLDDNMEQAQSFCKAKLGAFRELSKSYTTNQFISYDENRAIEYIKQYTDPKKEAYFEENVDIENLYYNMQKVLPDAEQTLTGNLMRKYIFHLKDVATTAENENINHVTVVVFPTTFDILSICPTTYQRNVVINDYEGLLSKQEEPRLTKKIERKSQIEKFNQRYHK